MGVKGVEQTYDSILRGIDGRRVVVVDSRGKFVHEELRQPSHPGGNLDLTLDLELQQEAERFFADKVGSAVALDPRNGEILAMVSAPSFNPNVFARRIEHSDWRAIVDAPHQPLQNRAMQNTYPPGSVFKIVTAIAALEQGTVHPNDAVSCSGATRVFNHTLPLLEARRPRPRRLEASDRAVVRRLLLPPRRAAHDRSDRELVEASRVGRGHRPRSGRREGGARSGSRVEPAPARHHVVPGRDRLGVHRPGPAAGDAAADGGDDGHRRQRRPRGATAPVAERWRRRPLARPACRWRRSTSSRTRSPPWSTKAAPAGARALATIRVAGKTGTAQVINQETHVDSARLEYEQRDHAWFASFAPVEDPRLVVVVFVEHGGHGSDAAAPLAKLLYERYLGSPPVPRDT